MKGPLVSIIIPIYNGAKFILEAISSVCAQDYDPMEIIVVDDGSTDDTSTIVQSFKDIRYIYQPNQGCAAARNTGIHNSKGELIAFLDADDYWAINKLSLQVDCLLKHPDIGYTLGMQRNFLECGIERPSWVKEEHILKEYIGTLQALVIRKRIFDIVGFFNTNFRISEDVEWFSRAVDAGIPRMVVPEVVAYRRIHDANLGYQLKGGNALWLKALRASVHRKRMKNSEA
jgi:glycosyltransferase involved in cell wall biosynthesis